MFFTADDDRTVRRESYLKATETGRVHFDSDYSDGGDISPQILKRYVCSIEFSSEDKRLPITFNVFISLKYKI